MKEITIEGINYICEIAKATQQTWWQSTAETVLIVLVVLLVIIGLIIGFYRLKKVGQDEE